MCAEIGELMLGSGGTNRLNRARCAQNNRGVAVWLERPVRDLKHDPDSRSGGVAGTISKQIGVTEE